ncbi:hypothetical protein ACFL54_08450 [Planctomycetota bacterium]
MAKRRRNYQTQWAGQFGVAHELSRRGYLATFTTGNAPATDLLCQSPFGISFSVEVKSLSVKTYFLIQDHLLEPIPDRYLIFVFIPRTLTDKPEYYILTNKQFRRLMEEEKEAIKEAEKKRGKPYAEFSKGINYKVLASHNFRDAWASLPQ